MDDISHGIRQKKVAAFMAVPDVLKHGKIADYQENWTSGGYGTAVALHQARLPVGIILPEFALSVQVVKTGFMYTRFSQ